mmetsp:Transcript_40380/g.99174  ORF Transcript_40380/g.99174 Transcript_40380/m.99174 type:complete len:142 (+) Transcript_40380:155-580(+)
MPLKEGLLGESSGAAPKGAEGGVPKDGVLYKRGNITVTESGVRLACYYFPFGAKTVKYTDIASVEEREYSTCSLRTKTWGMALDFSVWWHFDWTMREVDSDRLRALLLHVKGSWVLPGITPHKDDFDRVRDMIRERVAACA